jgi:hypothetical protein
MAKKKWIIPKLIILERGNPEESCLLACKPSGYQGTASGPTHAWGSSRCSAQVAYSCSGNCSVPTNS